MLGTNIFRFDVIILTIIRVINRGKKSINPDTTIFVNMVPVMEHAKAIAAATNKEQTNIEIEYFTKLR